MRNRFAALVLLLVLGFQSPAVAGEGELSLLSFQLGKFGAMVERAFSPIAQFAWTPRLETGLVPLRGELGLTLFKDAAGIEHPVINVEVFAALNLHLVLVELGGGAQIWTGKFGTRPDLGANLVIPIPSYLDRVYVGYARLFVPGEGIDEVKAGVGLKF